MKINPIQDFWSQIKVSFLGDNLMRKYANEKSPLRSELFSAEQLEQHARSLANTHTVIIEKAPEQLLGRLSDNEQVLLEVHELLTASAKKSVRISPAGEWLLDNFYIIEEQIYIANKHLPKGYSEGLPRLIKGPSLGLPRVYDIAQQIVSHSDGRVDMQSLAGFIRAYQSVAVLNLGELWAVPIMLRLALIENLRRLSAQIAIDGINKNLADYWADQMTETAEKDPKNLIVVIAEMAKSKPPMVSSFVAELTRRLLGKGPALALPLTWIEQRLSENGLTTNGLVYAENKKQAADQVSMSNSIGSLRFLSAANWRDFVESASVVEQVLREDPCNVYANMDFNTRDHYRHATEKMAKSGKASEAEVARLAVELAKRATESDHADTRRGHVGFYLIGKGSRQTERLARYRISVKERVGRLARGASLFLFAGGSMIITLLTGVLLLKKAYKPGMPMIWLIVLGFIIMISVSHFVVALANWVATLAVKPDILPRMDFSKGIPSASKTLVVAPSMMDSEDELDKLIETMEIRFLGNRDDNLHFALLTDFRDASMETLPGDAALLELAEQKISDLNKKYGRAVNDTFFIFHRPRKWNERDKIWMGYERKRGKLAELNALLRGRGRENFLLIVGEENAYSKTKYVITLDTDTELPRDAAWKITGAIAHPLNQAYYDPEKMRVTKGYTILQPRVENSMPGADSSFYARMHSDEAGIDPYTRAVSDVYQDLFGEGSFIGKGIYEVDAFEQSLSGRFPENRILSHDLLEGCYARSGLLSDVQLYEEYPSVYLDDMQRRRRWIRGDWQIARWLFPYAPGPGKKANRNPISALSKWKIFDNLRRSLAPPALCCLLIYGWLYSSTPWFWTALAMGLLIGVSAFSFISEMLRKPKDSLLVRHTLSAFRALMDSLMRHIFILVWLPHEAYINLHAIISANWRLLITRRNLLDWNPSGSASGKNKSIVQTYLAMWAAPVLAIIIFVLLAMFFPFRLLVAGPLLTLWLASPLIAWRVSLPMVDRKADITVQQTIFLRKLARKTWFFFEHFVGKEDNWLPPDNYQQNPVERIAHRTSPTNIGLSLLSNLTACDFGYITSGQMIERCFYTFNTMQAMERYKGHFYNWYDTVSLAAMYPRYISTVDSGNLAGHLLTLKQGLLELSARKIIGARLFEGIRDALYVTEEKIKQETAGNAGELSLLRPFKETLEQACALRSETLVETRNMLDRLSLLAENIITENDLPADTEASLWMDALVKQCRSAEHELLIHAGWLKLKEAPPALEDLLSSLHAIPTLAKLAKLDETLAPAIDSYAARENTPSEKEWLDAFRLAIARAAGEAREKILIIERLARQCDEFSDMDYDFLLDRSQNLLAIGYNVEEHRRDLGFYDLLGSEARLGIFVAIAQGKISQESWFALGRQLTGPGVAPLLLSWSGSMFEYLMPLLVMPTYNNTLLDQTLKSVVERQIEYGKKRGVYWGVSESGYNLVDAQLNYQYRAFGVPGLGLKRGLGEDMVIAPYASVMALMVSPEKACENLQELSKQGYEGRYGFFEAIDYTPARLPRGQSEAVVRSFMAHHEGMSFLSLAYLLLDQPMQKRFEAEPQFRAALLLLQEKIPRVTTLYSPSVHISEIGAVSEDAHMRVIHTPNTSMPEVQLLSNGRYHVMVTNSGGGYSRWRDVDITRWRGDGVSDNWGAFCFVKDVEGDQFWSAGYQPSQKQTDYYEVIFSQGRAEFRRRDNNIETHLEIVVSPEDDVEMRRVNINNRSRKRRVLEITSYTEIVLAHPAADVAHPAFSNLFVETETLPLRDAILCTRRPRSAEEHTPWMFHLMKAHGAAIEEASFETDRSRFIGRGNSIAFPDAMNQSGKLSGSSGSVLDPIAAIRYRITLEPQQSAVVDLAYGIGPTRELCMGLIDKYQDVRMTDRAFELAWTHAQVVLRQINATEAEAQLYGKLASSVIFPNAAMRADAGTLVKNHRGQSGLWSYSVSGDLPIVLLQIEDSANIELVKQMTLAHAYWRQKGLIVDLVIWNEDSGGYRHTLQNEIQALIAPSVHADVQEQPGGVFIRSAEQISNEDRILFQSVARIIITDKLGTLEGQLNRRTRLKGMVPAFTAVKSYPVQDTSVQLPEGLLFFNGIGGFSPDGKEYVVMTVPGKASPAPWVNVLANPGFGTVVSESGQAYTWVENAHELRLTPWNNDPVSDASGEAFYLRDEESGYYWSPSPLPCRGRSAYIARHGFGYSRFEHIEDGIASEMTVYVDIEAPVKFVVIKLHNRSGRLRRLTATGYVEWILGDRRSRTMMHVITELDMASGALLASNQYNTEFGGRVAFFDVDDSAKLITADREEFIGRNRTLRNPEAMRRAKLSGKIGAALDPCAATQVIIELQDGEEREVIFRLGAGVNATDAGNTARRFRGAAAAGESLKKVKEYWKRTLGSVQIETPDMPLNFLTNGWLNYQTLACRLWARSGFYQSGGAYGFRDQLQDSISLMHAKPETARAQILRCASRQFKEGDVQHWWHPRIGRGVRTRCSDDYLWLPYAVGRYVIATGDTGILDEQAGYLEGRALSYGEESYYDLPIRSDLSETLYKHCIKAIDYGLKFGRHGLPLMGSGDWNDGMDKVGEQGKGESVWLGFFLYDTIRKFLEGARLHADAETIKRYEEQAAQLQKNIEQHAWDGSWYRRAYFDDGTPLGSSSNDECKIDSIAQSWSVLSGAADIARAKKGMEEAYRRLVRKDPGLIQLFDPPFDNSALNPGYIKGYVPGVRENGGQYTHAAIWLVMAFAALRDKRRAWELLKMINPVHHGLTAEAIAVYKVEPYVIAADVYAIAQHTGRGGWTWYTGSAGWMYQLILESFIGLKRHAQILVFEPCLPPEWTTVKVDYTYEDTLYHILIIQDGSRGDEMIIAVDGAEKPTRSIGLVNDFIEHTVKVWAPVSRE